MPSTTSIGSDYIPSDDVSSDQVVGSTQSPASNIKSKWKQIVYN